MSAEKNNVVAVILTDIRMRGAERPMGGPGRLSGIGCRMPGHQLLVISYQLPPTRYELLARPPNRGRIEQLLSRGQAGAGNGRLCAPREAMVKMKGLL